MVDERNTSAVLGIARLTPLAVLLLPIFACWMDYNGPMVWHYFTGAFGPVAFGLITYNGVVGKYMSYRKKRVTGLVIGICVLCISMTVLWHQAWQYQLFNNWTTVACLWYICIPLYEKYAASTS